MPWCGGRWHRIGSRHWTPISFSTGTESPELDTCFTRRARTGPSPARLFEICFAGDAELNRNALLNEHESRKWSITYIRLDGMQLESTALIAQAAGSFG